MKAEDWDRWMDRANKARLIGSLMIMLAVGGVILTVELLDELKHEILSIVRSE